MLVGVGMEAGGCEETGNRMRLGPKQGSVERAEGLEPQGKNFPGRTSPEERPRDCSLLSRQRTEIEARTEKKV